MPSASRDELPLTELLPGYTSHLAEWGGLTVAFERAHAGQDVSSGLKGLPDDRCQAPHWGYLFSGSLTVDYGDRTERIEGGQAYYIAPGHTLTFHTDCEALEFTPTAELEKTLAAARRNLEADAGSGERRA